ncbi:MAG TPA: DNA repair protein RecO [Candidatus Margulisiibacteriota bacterium]|nr:DNA repair protein RecO [Candidatus Margulisiibacteriota bacterium]
MIPKTEAIVIGRRDFRETSLIAEFYTRDFGKMSGLLKGIRSDPQKFASNVEIFSFNEIIFYRKTRSELHLVSQCDTRESFNTIRQSIDKTAVASFMMELIGAVMPVEDRNEEIFNLALACLKELEATNNPDKIMTIFKIKMLSLSGFKPHFDSCVSCGNRVMGQSRFSLKLGGLLCPGCFRRDLASRSIFRGTVASIMHIEKNDFRSNLNLGLNPLIKRELGAILNAFLNFHLEKELKSQKVINKMAMAV